MAEHNIGFWGGMSLLISSITGPGLTTIPLLFQQAGWVTPIIAFLLFGTISCLASLFLVETMSTIRGNEMFQANVEYSTVAHLYLGRKAHIAMQVLLFLALQSVNISSIIISNQTMDSLLIRLFHKTCAVSFTEGWVCASETVSSGSPFDTYVLFSFGYLISAAMVLPLSVMSLVQNIKFQMASVATLFFVIVVWIYLFAHHGLTNDIPPIGNDQSTLVGFVLGNFAFITTVPSFINELSRSVSIHRTILYPILVCVVFYIVIGITGAASFKIDSSSDILATLSSSNQSKVLTVLVDILFPVAVLVTSVPVFSIVIRYNLVRGDLCSNRWAIFWASVLPWIIIVPLQTKGYLVLIMNWASLIFGSTTNFIIPLILFISSKIYSASTTDATGGDVFFLHRESSSASMNSSRRSQQPPSLHIPSNSVANAGLPQSYNVSSPTVTVTAPSDARRGSDSTDEFPIVKKGQDEEFTEIELQDIGEGSSSSIPLRVVYSPNVSRRPTIGSTSSRHRPANVRRLTLETSDEQSKFIVKTPPTPISPVLGSNLEQGHFRRRSSSVANSPVEDQQSSVDTRAASNRSLTYENSGSDSRRPSLEANVAGLEPTHFVALRSRGWVESPVVAKVCLVIVSLCVIGNIIYTAVESAKGDTSAMS